MAGGSAWSPPGPEPPGGRRDVRGEGDQVGVGGEEEGVVVEDGERGGVAGAAVHEGGVF